MIAERTNPGTTSEGLHSRMNHILNCQSVREQVGHDCRTSLQLWQSRWTMKILVFDLDIYVIQTLWKVCVTFIFWLVCQLVRRGPLGPFGHVMALLVML